MFYLHIHIHVYHGLRPASVGNHGSDALRTDEMCARHIKTFYMHVFVLQHIYHSLGKQRGALRRNVSVRHVSVNAEAC